jgi:hypothetical protein
MIVYSAIALGADKAEGKDAAWVRGVEGQVETSPVLALAETAFVQNVDTKSHMRLVNVAWIGFAQNVEQRWFASEQ